MSDEHRPARWGGAGKRSVRATGTSAAGRSPAPADVDATDAAKAHAAEIGVDLAAVEGSGVEGRITKDDVAAAAEPPDATPSENVEETVADVPSNDTA